MTDTASRVQRIRRARQIRLLLIQLPYVIVFIGVVLAAGLVLFDRWRRGAFVFGSALVFGAFLRTFIPTAKGNLLQVRGRVFDVVAMASVGAMMLWLATSIDPLGTD